MGAERNYMKYNPEVHHRKSIRLKDYGYSKEGLYFITICTKNRECILSEIVGADAHICPVSKMTDIGMIVEKYLKNINTSYENVNLMKYVVMPNHVHFIINIEEKSMEKGSMWASTPTVSKIVQTFKIIVTKTLGYSIWQRNYYEHIIRNDRSLNQIIEYIQYNPLNWKNDCNYR